MHCLKTAYRTLLLCCAAAAVLVVFSRPALAGSAYVSFAGWWPDIIGVGVTDSDYAMNNSHTAYATVTVTSPSGRTATNTGSDLGSVTVYTYLPLLGEDGYISARNVSEEYCPAVGRTFPNDPPPETGGNIDPYVFLSSVTAAPAEIERSGGDGGKSTIVVSAGKSPDCPMSSVSLAVSLHQVPSELKWIPPTATQVPVAFIGNTANQGFIVATSELNTTPGTIFADGMIYGATSCNLMGPANKQATIKVK